MYNMRLEEQLRLTNELRALRMRRRKIPTIKKQNIGILRRIWRLLWI